MFIVFKYHSYITLFQTTFYSIIVGLDYPLDGITNSKYTLLRFLKTKKNYKEKKALGGIGAALFRADLLPLARVLVPIPANARQRWKCRTMTNSLAFYGNAQSHSRDTGCN